MSKYGLSSEQVQQSLREHGNNTLPTPPRESFWQKLLENFQDPIIRILILALLSTWSLSIWGMVTGLKQQASS